LHEYSDELKIDRQRIAVGGQSAGGGHAAALVLSARDRSAIPICFQLLDSPMLDDRTGSTGDPHPVCGEFVWTAGHNFIGWHALLGMEPGSGNVPAVLVPARAPDLSRLPPTFIVVGSLDLFFEENLEYARRLVRAGVPTELHVIPGAFHGFASSGLEAPQVNQQKRLVINALLQAFARRAPIGHSGDI
jgi:triacylglycerol lipase